MAKQYFELGELVVLQCSNMPQLNGDYVVCDARVGQFWNPISDRFESALYRLNGLNLGGGNDWCIQSALRKKHYPGESMSEIMKKLKANDYAREWSGPAIKVDPGELEKARNHIHDSFTRNFKQIYRPLKGADTKAIEKSCKRISAALVKAGYKSKPPAESP